MLFLPTSYIVLLYFAIVSEAFLPKLTLNLFNVVNSFFNGSNASYLFWCCDQCCYPTIGRIFSLSATSALCRWFIPWLFCFATWFFLCLALYMVRAFSFSLMLSCWCIPECFAFHSVVLLLTNSCLIFGWCAVFGG